MILAAVIVRCPSNGRSASSTSGLLAPAAQTSVGRAASSCLPYTAALPPLAMPSLYSSTPPVILQRWQPHTAAEPVNPRTPLRLGIHCRVFPGSASSPSYASPSSTTLVHSTRRGQCGQRPTSIERVLYVERLTVGSTAAAGSTATTQSFCDLPSKLFFQACWAANLSRRGELHSAGRENGLSVMRNGLYIFKTHQTGN